MTFNPLPLKAGKDRTCITAHLPMNVAEPAVPSVARPGGRRRQNISR